MAAKGKKNKDVRSHPWRDNIEALTVSVVLIVLFKYFVLEAYKIPTGSMQPTLMGWQERDGPRGIFDRVLVNKLAYHHRDPERFEIVVFKYPLDRSKNFIKRLWGMPDETLELRNGDVFVRPNGTEMFQIPRRPEPVLDAMLKELETAGEWKTERKWSFDGGDLVASGDGAATYPKTGSIKDRYGDGYPPKLRAIVDKERPNAARNHVGDLRVETRVDAEQGCGEVSIVFAEGDRRYVVSVPGPAAGADARPAIVALRTSAEGEVARSESESPWRLSAGTASPFVRRTSMTASACGWTAT